MTSLRSSALSANGRPAPSGDFGEIFLVFLQLGLTSFGGPIAHLGYFRVEFVERRRWLSEQSFADLVALSQFLPGPASSQTGFGVGLLRGGLLGGLAAWAGFTLPSAILMVLFAYGAESLAESALGAGLLHGLKLVAVAIVAQAVMGMARTLCPDRTRASIATVALVVTLVAPWSIAQLAVIVAGGCAGLLMCNASVEVVSDVPLIPVSRRAGLACLATYFALLAVAFLPTPPGAAALFDAFYRSGALAFGGGHVVLPLLRNAVVAPGWVPDGVFLAGYGAAQALPGPLFTFAAFLGAVASVPPHGIAGAALRSSPSSFRACFALSAPCPSGARSAPILALAPPCWGQTPRSSACSALRSITRSGRALCEVQSTSRLPPPGLFSSSPGGLPRSLSWGFRRLPASV